MKKKPEKDAKKEKEKTKGDSGKEEEKRGKKEKKKESEAAETKKEKSVCDLRDCDSCPDAAVAPQPDSRYRLTCRSAERTAGVYLPRTPIFMVPERKRKQFTCCPLQHYNSQDAD